MGKIEPFTKLVPCRFSFNNEMHILDVNGTNLPDEH